MKILETALLRIGLGIWAVFACLIAIDVGLFFARFGGEGIFFRWQVWCLAGILVIVLRDRLLERRTHSAAERLQQ